jgi:hypothetical protein
MQKCANGVCFQHPRVFFTLGRANIEGIVTFFTSEAELCPPPKFMFKFWPLFPLKVTVFRDWL